MYSELTTEMASINGVATDAVRRRLERVLAQASSPGALWRAARGRPTSQANGHASKGPRRAAATINSIAAAGASLSCRPPELRAASSTTAIPPRNAASPMTALGHEIGRA